MTAYKLKNIAVVNVKDVDYCCILWNLTKNEVVNLIKKL